MRVGGASFFVLTKIADCLASHYALHGRTQRLASDRLTRFMECVISSIDLFDEEFDTSIAIEIESCDTEGALRVTASGLQHAPGPSGMTPVFERWKHQTTVHF